MTYERSHLVLRTSKIICTLLDTYLPNQQTLSFSALNFLTLTQFKIVSVGLKSIDGLIRSKRTSLCPVSSSFELNVNRTMNIPTNDTRQAIIAADIIDQRTTTYSRPSLPLSPEQRVLRDQHYTATPPPQKHSHAAQEIPAAPFAHRTANGSKLRR